MTTGIIEKKIEIRKEDIKPFDVLTIDGQEYSCFDLGMSKLANEGDQIDFDFKQSGQYKNITAIRAIKPEAAKPKVERNDQIARMCALKAAVQWFEGGAGTVENLLQTAEKFLKWIIGE